MRFMIAIGSILILLSICTEISVALPRFALMAGAKCGSCHVNPTGGQMRNEYGVNFGRDAVPLRATMDEDFMFNSKLTDNISIGGDYRSQFIYDQFSKNSTFQAMTTTLYGAVNLTKKVVFYFKYDIINGTYGGLYGGAYNGTEVYGLAKIFPGGWYMKGGDFLPDYGWRVDDHTAYTRGGDLGFIRGLPSNTGLIFSPNYKDIGAEVGGYIENLFISSGVFNGSGHTQPIDFSKQKAYVAKIEYLGTASGVNFRLGASGYGYKSYKMGGFTAGFATGDVVLFGEIDWTHEQLLGTSIVPGMNTMAAYAELDYRAIQGLWLIGKFEIFDPLQGQPNDDSTPTLNSIQRVTLGLEFFPYSFVEVRPQFRLHLEKPSVNNNNVFLVQMHLWF